MILLGVYIGISHASYMFLSILVKATFLLTFKFLKNIALQREYAPLTLDLLGAHYRVRYVNY